MHCAEYHDLVAAHVDGLLTAEEAPLAAAHVAACPECARVLQQQRAFKQTLRAGGLIQPVPSAVRRRLLARIEAEARAVDAVPTPGAWWSRPMWRLAMVAVAALVVVAIAVPLMRSGSREGTPDLFGTIVERYRAAEAQAVNLDVTTDEPDELRAFYRQSGAFNFTNTVLDLEPLGYVLVGGAVVQLGASKSTMTLYRGAQWLVLCHRIHASQLPAAPPGGEVVGGDTFYTVGGITIALHREGDVVCFMASAMPRDQFIKHMTLHA